MEDGILGQIWSDMYKVMKVLNGRTISDYVSAGEVSPLFVQNQEEFMLVCVDTCSTLGICAERNAIFV